MSLANLGEPVMLVLSPIFTKLVSGVSVSDSNPLKRKYFSGWAGFLGEWFLAFSAMHPM